MIFQTTPDALDKVEHTISKKAELTPLQIVDKDGNSKLRVSGYRSEVGAITEVELHSAANRVLFSAEEAVAWLKKPNVMSGSYLVELFTPRAIKNSDALPALLESLQNELEQLPSGIIARPFFPREATDHFGAPPLAFSVRLIKNTRCKEISFLSLNENILPTSNQNVPPIADEFGDANRDELDLSPNHHQFFLDIVTRNPLVRKIELPPMIEAFPASTSAQSACPKLPSPAEGRDYPIVGIIDGGVANIPALATWQVSEAGICIPEHRDETHGTFIAALIAAGATLNPHIANELEPQGCMFFDLDIFPRKDLQQHYYSSGPEYFFDLLDEKIKFAKQNHGVRVFNFSYYFKPQGGPYNYSFWADRFDRIARTNDVIIVISAGNLPPEETRPPWPAEATSAVTMLAGISVPQQIVPPAEHLLGLTVGAINPPNIEGHEARVPTTYTRRGPGTGRARKPDLAHFGGAAAGHLTGLSSLAPNGDRVESCGTSYACPNVSTMLATLDHRLAHAQPREVLLALSIHQASRADSLNDQMLRHVARDFVGFGLPPTADTLLAGAPSAITLVFNGTLMHKQKLEFPFAWPTELVKQAGKCRGQINLTLAFTPPIDSNYQDEAMRVQLEAYLHQETINSETGECEWTSRLDQDGSGLSQGMSMTEGYLLKTGLKWSPIKHYTASFPRGRGTSSNWRLLVKSLTRAGAPFPNDGVPFAIILTIADPRNEAPVHNSVRKALRDRGHTIADITVAHRIRTQHH